MQRIEISFITENINNHKKILKKEHFWEKHVHVYFSEPSKVSFL